MSCAFAGTKVEVELTKEQAEKLFEDKVENKRNIEQAQKLFTCSHGLTLNWKQARMKLGLK